MGVKIAAGHIEQDLAFCTWAEPDFITIDGRGGATGSSPKFLRDSASLPTIYALYRARKYLDSIGSDISLIITGGLRVSSDFAKALAMGADAVAVATAPLMALGCQQYRICGSGRCPMGIATQDPDLRARLKIEPAAKRVANFLNTSLEELKTFARVTGHSRLATCPPQISAPSAVRSVHLPTSPRMTAYFLLAFCSSSDYNPVFDS